MTSQQLLTQLKENPFVLAPMAGITDHSFRTLMRELQSSVVVSELISANGIEYDNEKTLAMMGYDEVQRPVAIQLFGDDPEVLANAAKVVEARGVDFIDLNFGCPVPKVTKKGAGSAMLKDPATFQKVLQSVVSAVKIPVTIKIRTGWDQNSRNSEEICNIAYNEGITWVAIHGRTRSQNYDGLADWDYITEIKTKVKIPILGNGDIHTPEQAIERLLTSGCDGVLIGRGALKNPFIFKEALKIFKSMNPELKTAFSLMSPEEKQKGLQELSYNVLNEKREFSWVLKELNNLYSMHCSDQLREIQLKKFSAWFSAGYPGSAKFRKEIFQLKNCDQILDLALNYFRDFDSHSQEDTSGEKFLMGGHG